MTSHKYEHLAQPINIGGLEIRNRFMKNGTGFFWDDPTTGSYLNQRYLDHYAELAKGGTGLLSSATGPLTRDLDATIPGFKVLHDRYLPGWRDFADTVHRGGAVAFTQLFHLGPMTPLFVKAPAGVSASVIPKDESPRPGFEEPRELTVPEIEDIVDLFASAAERMKQAGVDGTELNAACNHLIACFLSRAWNRRTDEYGPQSIANRTRLAVQIISEIKRRNGADWPLIMLFNAQEIDLRDGVTIDESIEFAKTFVEAGADALEVRAEYYTWTNQVERRQSLHFPDMYVYPAAPSPQPPLVSTSRHAAGANIPMAAAIKQVVTVPVITVGRLDPDLGERAIAEGRIDMISLNRRLLADPHLPVKVLSGRSRDVNPCSSCLTCFDACEHFEAVRCRVNPSLGREREYRITPARRKQRVVVIGGGPAGMEAARVTALRGHDVALFEKQPRLGGSLPVAALVKGEREDLMGLVAYLARQVRRAGVRVRCGRTASAELVSELNPDQVIVATGGRHQLPDIPGIDSRKVLTAHNLHSLAKLALTVASPQVLRRAHRLPIARNLLVGDRVVVMGGRLHGCQTAEYLVKMGKQVTIVDEGPQDLLGEGLLEVFLKPYLLWWLADNGVRFITDVEYQEVTEQGLVVAHAGGQPELLRADTVVTALPLLPNTELADKLRARGTTVHSIGDAADPGLIIDAIHAGAAVGREI